MAQMITDSYLNYNDLEFTSGKNHHHHHPPHLQSGKYLNSSVSNSTTNKPPLPSSTSSSFSVNDQQRHSINFMDSQTTRKQQQQQQRGYTEEAILQILKGNNYTQQFELFEELNNQAQTSIESLVNLKNLDDFLNSLGYLLTQTINNDVQRSCLKFLQIYFKSLDRLKQQTKNAANASTKVNTKYKIIDSAICSNLLEYLIECSVSAKIQLKQFSIDLIYSYMKITDDLNGCLDKFARAGIEAADVEMARRFIDSTLYILLTDEFKSCDLLPLVKSLVKQLTNPKCESAAFKCLNKIEKLTDRDRFTGAYLAKLPANLRQTYLNKRNQAAAAEETGEHTVNINGSGGPTGSNGLKFNIIPNLVVLKLTGEDETQRLQAIKQLEDIIVKMSDVRAVHPYYTDFIAYMNNFVDDANYEIRLGSLKILNLFTGKLDANINHCFKVLCTCVRNVLSQTHQSKTIKQSVNTLVLVTIKNMQNPVLFLDCLLDKIKDRSAKSREEFLNVAITGVLNFPFERYDSLRKTFFQVAPLITDIKRNVRHAALECLAVIFNRLKQVDRNAGSVIEQLDQVSDFNNIDNIQLIRDVITYRLNRNKIASLNGDMTLDYGLKIPSSGVSFTSGHDLDIEWIVSATSSTSLSASNMSSARSNRSFMGNDANLPPTSNSHRILNPIDNNMSINTGSFRRPSAASKRVPWDEMNDFGAGSSSIPKVMRSREVAPLRAFPLNDETDFLNSNSINSFTTGNKNGYPMTTSYQEKYLKKIQSSDANKTANRIDLDFDSNEAALNEARKLQNEKAYSLDNLYNLDDNYNSGSAGDANVQKRKYANLNLKNGALKEPIIPSKPIIPRRNSANKYAELDSTRTTATNNTSTTTGSNNNSQFDYDIETLDSMSTNRSKYDTVPNVRNSAKNRRKLEKMFSLGLSTNQQPVGKSVPNEENNLYLSKLRADGNMNMSRYSPSNPESGFFSMSEYEINENNRFIRQQQMYNTTSNEPRKQSQQQQQSNSTINRSIDNTKLNLNLSGYLNESANDDEYEFSNSIHNNPNNNIDNNNNVNNKTSNHQAHSNYHNNDTSFLIAPLNIDVVSIPFHKKPVLLKSSSKSKIDVANVNNKQAQQTQANGNNMEYKPLAGVSFKQTHSSDVEIVGVKLGNQNNNTTNVDSTSNMNNLNAKKKNSLKNLNENMLFNNDYDSANNVNEGLDIVGKGYNNNYSNANNDYDFNENDVDFSLSFQSRIEQKKQEKQNKRVEKMKQMSGEGEKNDFGLSISGYQSNNGANISHKPPIYEPNVPEQAPINPYDEFNERKIKTNHNYNIDNLNDPYADVSPYASNLTTLPSLAADKPRQRPTKATQSRLKAKEAAAAAAAIPPRAEPPTSLDNYAGNEYDKKSNGEKNGFERFVKEDFAKQPFKSPENALKEALNLLSQDDWEKKCHAMNMIRRLSVYHEDLAVSNIHTIVLALLKEVNNLRSQVSRFALFTFGDLFTNLKKYMDVDLDQATKTILQKYSESLEFMRSDVDKCLDKMIRNVTTHKALLALINGGASHKNALVRRPTAQYVYQCCEIMGPGKILSGIKDVTEKTLNTCAHFVVDGPIDIRWFGRKIFHMLMSHDEFERMLNKYVSESTRKNIKEILDQISSKGPGDAPTESARNMRKGVRHNTNESISRSAGSSNPNAAANGLSDSKYASESSSLVRPGYAQPAAAGRLDPHSQEYVRNMCNQMRSNDFRERISAIENFQVLCERETNVAVSNLVQIFDKYNSCLTESNSKVNYKALNTMYQITPILGDDLNPIIANVVPIIAQHLASKNGEIQDMASNILDAMIEYLEGGVLIQPFSNIAQHGNARVRPHIIFKLADLIPNVYARKQKQIELHVLPTLWSLLGSVKGSSATSSGNLLNASISRLVQSLYEQMGDQLVDRASNSSSVSARNLEILKDFIKNPIE